MTWSRVVFPDEGIVSGINTRTFFVLYSSDYYFGGIVVSY